MVFRWRTARGRFLALLGLALGACAAPAPEAEAPLLSASASPAAPLPAPTVSAPPLVQSALPPEVPPPPPPTLRYGGVHAVSGKAGLVTSVESHASRAGAAVLEQGGNAIDAAITVAAVLAVTHPSAGNIGGGGFFLVHLASGETVALDFRETGPAAVTTEGVLAMVDKEAGVGYRSAGVPGTVAGLVLARERFGTKPMAELLAPAIALAEKGHKLGARQALTLSWAWPSLKRDAAAKAVFGRGNRALHVGETVLQKDLARTLRRVAEGGNAGFYEGPVAERFAAAMTKKKGLVTLADLRAYRALERAPISLNYRGLRVDTMPPPSMGGVAVAETLRFLELTKAYEQPGDSGAWLHLFIEASRRAYADRRIVGADPEAYGVEASQQMLARLLDPARIAAYLPPVDGAHATLSKALGTVDAPADESPETTHFSVVDALGNAVSGTVTLSAGFGAKVIVPGTGVLLGNALGAFSPTGSNAPGPGKRPASSMAPTLLSREGQLIAVLGSPGGNTIPNTVVQVLTHLVDHQMTIDEAVRAPRIHHQYLPDKVRIEGNNRPTKEALLDLASRGHTLDASNIPMGDANDLVIDPSTGEAWGYADDREGGEVVGVAKVRGPVAPPL